ncbi:hypothetical protein [Bifidobacterium thermophilum]|uniref:hypothetical protein n=1 Tax=Bifidobacterium thermophilum TaxID=33905 RepID=UPI0030A8F1DF
MPRHPSLPSWGNTEAGTPRVSLVLLTGVDRLAIDAVAFSLADSRPAIRVAAYDVAPDPASPTGLSLVRTVYEPGNSDSLLGGDTTVFPMDDCCLTCACKHDLVRVMNTAPEWSGAMLAVLPVGVEGTAVAQYLADSSMLGDLPCAIDTIHVATAVGLDGFESRLFDDDRLVVAGTTDDDAVLDSRSTGVVQTRLIREAAHILMLPMLAADGGAALTDGGTALGGAGLDEADLDGAAMSPRQGADETARLSAVVTALADPAATIHPDAHCADLHALIGDVCTPSRVRV